MAPNLEASLVAAVAWGTTVADIRQAAVMLRAGMRRLILANEVAAEVARAGLGRRPYFMSLWILPRLSMRSPGLGKGGLQPLQVLIEMGVARVGALLGASLPLLLTAGGSVFFDRVVTKLGPLVATDRSATLVLRSGSLFFNDHGLYERVMAAIDARSGFGLDGACADDEDVSPGAAVWAKVLCLPEPGQAICGMGMREVSFDQDLPRPLQVYRVGRPFL